MNAQSTHTLPLTVTVKQTQQKTKDMTLASLKDKQIFSSNCSIIQVKNFEKRKKEALPYARQSHYFPRKNLQKTTSFLKKSAFSLF